MPLMQELLTMLGGSKEATATHSLLDTPLLYLTGRDAWTVRDAVGGAVIFGGPGSGKSSGPGRHLAMSFLEAGFGGLVLCAKPGEATKWMTYAQEAGRSGDVIRFSPEHPELRFNPLDYEIRRSGRGGGYTTNVTALFKMLLEISDEGKEGGNTDKFWTRAVIELLSYSVDVLATSGEPVSLANINRLIQSCPRRDGTIDDFYDDGWRDSSFCFYCLSQAATARQSPEGKADLELAASYLVEEFPSLGERTRSSILATFKGMALPFLRSPMREVFGSDTTLRIEDIFERGKILIIDYPIREFAEVGRLVGALMKYFFMTAVERRVIDETSPPCFLFADEAQEFVTSYDARFMATARESRCCTVFVTQNISGLYSAVKAQNAKFVVDALLANFMSKLWCANADSLTNSHAADLIAQSWQLKSGSSTSSGQNPSMGSNISQQMSYQILPAEFTRLAKGEPPNWIVETILFQGGRLFTTSGATYARIAFPQR